MTSPVQNCKNFDKIDILQFSIFYSKIVIISTVKNLNLKRSISNLNYNKK